MKARDVMTRAVVSVTPDCTIKELAKRMQQYRISGLPVINAGGALSSEWSPKPIVSVA